MFYRWHVLLETVLLKGFGLSMHSPGVCGSQAHQNTGRGVVGRDAENGAADHRHRGSYIGSIIKQGSSHQAIDGGVRSHKLSHRCGCCHCNSIGVNNRNIVRGASGDVGCDGSSDVACRLDSGNVRGRQASVWESLQASRQCAIRRQFASSILWEYQKARL